MKATMSGVVSGVTSVVRLEPFRGMSALLPHIVSFSIYTGCHIQLAAVSVRVAEGKPRAVLQTDSSVRPIHLTCVLSVPLQRSPCNVE